MRIFINATSAISPQLSYDSQSYLSELKSYDGLCMNCIEPEYRAVIDPKLLRRMSRIIRMGVATAMKSLDEAGIDKPGALTIGTGLGCLADTEKFLSAVVSQDSVLSPTPFIQSTHNTIGGQISLLLQSHAYNFTYAQRAHSFENALQDALMMIGEGTENILVGGIDEVTNTSVDVISKLPCGHESPTSTSQIGEGSAFFVLSANKQPHTYAQIVAFETKYGSAETEALADWIRNCLIQANLKIADVDGLLLGESGDVQDDQLYGQIKHRLFPHTPSFAFKSLSGEYFTAVSFGLNLAANMIKHQQFYSLGSMPSGSQGINSLLIYNHYKNKYHSLILLQKC